MRKFKGKLQVFTLASVLLLFGLASAVSCVLKANAGGSHSQVLPMSRKAKSFAYGCSEEDAQNTVPLPPKPNFTYTRKFRYSGDLVKWVVFKGASEVGIVKVTDSPQKTTFWWQVKNGSQISATALLGGYTNMRINFIMTKQDFVDASPGTKIQFNNTTEDQNND